MHAVNHNYFYVVVQQSFSQLASKPVFYKVVRVLNDSDKPPVYLVPSLNSSG